MDIQVSSGRATSGARAAPERLTVTVREAIELSGLSNTTLYKLIGQGRLRTVKVGGRTLITYASLTKGAFDA
jgi:excisionase family DNA binding protein